MGERRYKVRLASSGCVLTETLMRRQVAAARLRSNEKYLCLRAVHFA